MDTCASCRQRPAATWATRHVGALAARSDPLCGACAAALGDAMPPAGADGDAWLRALGPLDMAHMEAQLPHAEASASAADLAASAAALARAAALHAQVLTPPLRAFVARHA
jgi:hypothetical protein